MPVLQMQARGAPKRGTGRESVWNSVSQSRGQGKEWDLPGSGHPREVSGKVMSQTGGNPRAEGGQGKGNPSFPEPLMSRRFLEGPSVLPPRAEVRSSSPFRLWE